MVGPSEGLASHPKLPTLNSKMTRMGRGLTHTAHHEPRNGVGVINRQIFFPNFSHEPL